MRRTLSGWNIVLAGLWNRLIFSPEWVTQHIFNEAESETLISIMPHFPLVYQISQVALEVSGPRLIIRPRALNDECLERSETVARTILERLPETPLSGVGINFGFAEDTLSEPLAQLFGFGDDGELSGTGWTIGERKLIRQLTLDEDVLNLTLTFAGDNVSFGFNFHTATISNAVARQAVTNRVVRLRDASLAVLGAVYHLEETENNE